MRMVDHSPSRVTARTIKPSSCMVFMIGRMRARANPSSVDRAAAVPPEPPSMLEIGEMVAWASRIRSSTRTPGGSPPR